MSGIHEFLDPLDAARIHHTLARARGGWLRGLDTRVEREDDRT